MLRLYIRCGITIPSAQKHSTAFNKDKCLEPMFGDARQAYTFYRVQHIDRQSFPLYLAKKMQILKSHLRQLSDQSQ